MRGGGLNDFSRFRQVCGEAADCGQPSVAVQTRGTMVGKQTAVDIDKAFALTLVNDNDNNSGLVQTDDGVRRTVYRAP